MSVLYQLILDTYSQEEDFINLIEWWEIYGMRVNYKIRNGSLQDLITSDYENLYLLEQLTFTFSLIGELTVYRCIAQNLYINCKIGDEISYDTYLSTTSTYVYNKDYFFEQFGSVKVDIILPEGSHCLRNSIYDEGHYDWDELILPPGTLKLIEKIAYDHYIFVLVDQKRIFE